jgi:GNAT superfamily N-acetyltransferase
VGKRPKWVIAKTLASMPALKEPAERLGAAAWPAFLYHSDIRGWQSLFTKFTPYQIVLFDTRQTLLAVGHTLPIPWDGTIEDLPSGIDAIIQRAIASHRDATAPTALTALAAIVAPSQRGKGLSAHLVQEMVALASRHHLQSLIAPVRPTLKSLYPLMPMERYVALTREDGAPFDPWIRVHWRLGAHQVAIAPKTLTVTGTVDQWEEWTGRKFTQTGSYLVRGALEPITIDLDLDLGRYDEPNIWMQHKVQPPAQ